MDYPSTRELHTNRLTNLITVSMNLAAHINVLARTLVNGDESFSHWPIDHQKAVTSFRKNLNLFYW